MVRQDLEAGRFRIGGVNAAPDRGDVRGDRTWGQRLEHRVQPGATVGGGAWFWVPGGTFAMGSDRHYPEECPTRKVSVDGFWMDRYAVTNARFQRFVEATGHVTLAERPADPADYPGAIPEMLVPSSVMFQNTSGPVDLRNHMAWWVYTAGADWRHPRGPECSLEDLWDHPVVHVGSGEEVEERFGEFASDIALAVEVVAVLVSPTAVSMLFRVRFL